VILSGPPGVGKTRACEDFVSEMLKQHEAKQKRARITDLFPEFTTGLYDDVDIESVLASNSVGFIWDLCVLHPQYTYEDLIRGYRVISSEGDRPMLEVREGLLGFMARVVSILERSHPSNTGETDLPTGVLILDEINRAPIGQLFGEAMYALDRRGFPVATPYHLKGVGSDLKIPRSLFLLGTMNSVDRAVSGFDFAFRRRFATLTMVPSERPIEGSLEGFDSAKHIAVGLYNRVRMLVLGSIETGVVPLSELVVGHSYFMPTEFGEDEERAIEWLSNSYRYQILPILLDYHEQGLLEYQEGDLDTVPAADVLRGERSLGDVKLGEIVTILKTYSIAEEPQPADGTADG
jgi:5-methylcytosine-specific restriction protein B